MKIAAAAIQVSVVSPYDGQYTQLTISLPRPARHHHILHAFYEIYNKESVQGFLTDEGTFVDREEGFRIAKAADQILIKHGPKDVLFSEDMW